MPSPLRIRMFIKSSEALQGQETCSSLARNLSENVSWLNSSRFSFHVCISAQLESPLGRNEHSVCLQKMSSGFLSRAVHVYTCVCRGGEIPSEFFHRSECCKHLNQNRFLALFLLYLNLPSAFSYFSSFLGLAVFFVKFFSH